MVNKRNHTLDFLRVVAAFLVVYAHMPFPGALGRHIIPFCRTAGSFFFMVSGYLVAAYPDANRDIKLQKQIKHIFFLLMGSSLFYFVFNFFRTYEGPASMLEYLGTYTQATMTPDRLRDFALFNRSPFMFHLWFLGSMLYALIIYYFLRKDDNRYKMAIKLIPLLLFVNLTLGAYAPLLFGEQLIPMYSRNFLLLGLPYLLLGAKMREINEVKLGNGQLIALFCLLQIMVYVERAVAIHYRGFEDGEYFITTPFLSIVLFLLIIKNPDTFANSPFTQWGRQYSLMIYIMHPAVEIMLKKLVSFTTLSNATFRWILPFGCFGLSLLFSIGFYRLIGWVKQKNATMDKGA